MNVSVFGGSQLMEGSQEYREAEVLGAALATGGHTVLTGGYAGTMAAVSRGASFAGGHVIGVTCAEIERSHNVVVNKWIAEEWKRETLLERLKSLIGACDAALVLPGGPGTLTELALSWNLMIVGALSRKPLILVGGAWQAVISEFYQELGQYTPPHQRDLLSFVADAAGAVEFLQRMS